jgi:hypothetical protein
MNNLTDYILNNAFMLCIYISRKVFIRSVTFICVDISVPNVLIIYYDVRFTCSVRLNIEIRITNSLMEITDMKISYHSQLSKKLFISFHLSTYFLLDSFCLCGYIQGHLQKKYLYYYQFHMYTYLKHIFL